MKIKRFRAICHECGAILNRWGRCPYCGHKEEAA